jgi:hypothetical protein
MRLVILHVPACPNAAVLESRLAPILASRPDLHITRTVITTEEQARRQGMAGSPTLLLDGSDPFARPGQQLSLSCRLYLSDDGRPWASTHSAATADRPELRSTKAAKD